MNKKHNKSAHNKAVPMKTINPAISSIMSRFTNELGGRLKTKSMTYLRCDTRLRPHKGTPGSVPLMRVEFQAPGDHRSSLLGKIRRLVEAGLSGERKESTLDLEGPKVHEDQGPEPAQPAPVIPPAAHAPSSGGSPPREGAPLEDLL